MFIGESVRTLVVNSVSELAHRCEQPIPRSLCVSRRMTRRRAESMHTKICHVVSKADFEFGSDFGGPSPKSGTALL
jgi:hypothetical protein